MLKVVAIIIARGGSKGIPNKNIIDFCGKPLIVWTIEQLQRIKGIDSIWVSSDSKEILDISRQCGTKIIIRPDDISKDTATSESGWLHALDSVEDRIGKVDIVIAPQVTSPLRETSDLEWGLRYFREQKCDSMFSCCVIEDFFTWERDPSNFKLRSVNYDFNSRQRRQKITKRYLENGSFYIFKPDIIRKYQNRFGGKIGLVEMEFWKMFQIDKLSDIKLAEVIMKGYGLDK